MKFKPKVSIIILNWNGWGDTIECLKTLISINYPNYDVVLVDNGSTNDSVKQIRDWLNEVFKTNCKNNLRKFVELDEKQLTSNDITALDDDSGNVLYLLKNHKNYGFSKGNNIGLNFISKHKPSEYSLLLNNDTVVSEDFLDILVDSFELSSDVAIAGPKMYFYNFNDKKNIIWYGGGVLNWRKFPIYYHVNEFFEDKNRNESKAPHETEWVSGACMLVKSSIISPLLDESYYFGCEDVDKCIKTKKLGKMILYVPNSVIWHKVGASRKKTLIKRIQKNIVNIKLIIKNIF